MRYVDRLCDCERFTRWYTNDDVPTDPLEICRCGHPQHEHVDGRLACVGEVTVNR